jgi:hypothetical protein
VAEGFNFPAGLAAGPAGIVYVTDTGTSSVRKIGVDGQVSLLAGGSSSPVPAALPLADSSAISHADTTRRK